MAKRDEGDVPDGFTNGESVHFTYNENENESPSQPGNPSASNSKKKKKKKKGKREEDAISHHQVQHATLNNPHDEYPTSRVIKQAPNGDVIVESLDEDTHAHSHPHSHAHPRLLPHPNPASIWDNSTLEEQESLKNFWETLEEPQKIELVKIDKQSIMEIFKQETRNAANKDGALAPNSGHGHAHGHGHGHGHAHGHAHGHGHGHGHAHAHGHAYGKSNCTYCGRRSGVIEDELENIYDNHFDDIIDFIHEVRDINDLNALPGLLFGGFHMLEEEHKLQKLKERQLRHQQHVEEEEIEHDIYEVEEEEEEVVEDEDKPEAQPDDVLRQIIHNESASELTAPTTADDTDRIEAVQKILDPKLYQALNNIAFDKLREDMSSNEKHVDFLEKVGSLREVVKQLHQVDKFGLEQGINFLQNFGGKFSQNEAEEGQLERGAGPVEQWAKGLLSFADDLLKNDGKSFIEMMEALSESRGEREDILKKEAWVDDEEEEEEEEEEDDEDDDDDDLEDVSGNAAYIRDHIHHHNHHCDHHHDHEHGHEEDEDDDDEDEDDEGGNDEDDDYETNSVDIDVSDAESEISEEEKMQEIRRLFLIQVIKLFQERLKSAYKKKLSEDRTKMLIEELEAEENAKKERELKKLKQKEKAKEKKRLQQVAKEEEKRKKEEEERLRIEEEKKKLEAQREEQRKRKEEARLKREEEKRKRAEELKRKEVEQQKRVELQKKKEEEARKVKEERKKKAEELKKQKELAKKQKEQDRELAKREREKREAELEADLLLKEQSEILNKISIEENIIDNDLTSLLTSAEVPLSIPVNVSPVSNDRRTSSSATNHLLEQLYQAKPRSSSSSFNSRPVSVSLATANPTLGGNLQHTWNNNVIEDISPIMSQTSIPQQFHHHTLLGGNNMDFLNSSIPSVIDTQQNLHQFFSDSYSTPLNNWGTPSVNPTAGGASLTARNGSIWGSTGNLWGAPQQPHQAPQAPQTQQSHIHQPQPQPQPLVILSQGHSPQAQQPIIQSQSPNNTNGLDELLQSGAVQAFQILQQTQQLEFGVAPTLRLFQTTKNIIGDLNLSLNQFLSSCRYAGSNGYRFDFIYDDIGTVTHIKVQLQSEAQGQPIQASPILGHNNLIQSISPFVNGANSGRGGGLWN